MLYLIFVRLVGWLSLLARYYGLGSAVVMEDGARHLLEQLDVLSPRAIRFLRDHMGSKDW